MALCNGDLLSDIALLDFLVLVVLALFILLDMLILQIIDTLFFDPLENLVVVLVYQSILTMSLLFAFVLADMMFRNIATFTKYFLTIFAFNHTDFNVTFQTQLVNIVQVCTQLLQSLRNQMFFDQHMFVLEDRKYDIRKHFIIEL